jgi:hypothetical protein
MFVVDVKLEAAQLHNCKNRIAESTEEKIRAGKGFIGQITSANAQAFNTSKICNQNPQ